MRVDLNKYLINREFVRKYYADKPTDDLPTMISILAVGTMCPCIVIAYWIGEESNWHPDVIDTIKSLTKFYGYSEIVGKPEGSPI